MDSSTVRIIMTPKHLREINHELKVIINYLCVSQEVPEDREEALAKSGLFDEALVKLRALQKEVQIEVDQQ